MNNLVISTILRRGQVHLPTSWQRKLNLKPGDKLILQINNDTIIIHKANFINKLLITTEQDYKVIETEMLKIDAIIKQVLTHKT